MDKYQLKPSSRFKKDLKLAEKIDAKENVLSPTSIDGYRNKRRNCLQSIMEIPLSDLTNAQIQSAVNQDAVRLSP